MIYPDNFEKKIGFDAVRTMVEKHCSSGPGKRLVAEMSFSTDITDIRRLAGETEELVKILNGVDDFPWGVIKDLDERLNAIRPDGTYLTGQELADLGVNIATGGAIGTFFKNRHNETGGTPYPYLNNIARNIERFPEIARTIDRTVDRYGDVKDTASQELSEIRRNLARMGGTINSAMRRVITTAVRDGLLDADVTASVRDGRLVIPVAPMNKRRIPGIVHDESASGKTVYIEPAEVVEANNRLRELQMEEKREEIKILTAVTSSLRPYIPALKSSFNILARLDFIRAKALWAIEIGACTPHVADKPELEWYRAFHPVLSEHLHAKGKEIIPLDITLTPLHRILVVSGPNAGGKSVTIKTVAIIQYMFQCGMPVPVADNSHFGIFENIFIDIGDDQSMEDDLSTYSSHLKNMKFFLSKGNQDTLFLIDEFGSGTEPQIGGAIAQALLEDFNEKKMWGVVTTHFQNLKQYAGETEGLINGSMLYERREMRPLFILSIGQPGSSFAIEIARNIGLPDSIIKTAGDIVGSDYMNLDKYLLDIARDKRYWENKRQQIRVKEKKINDAIQRYESEADTLRIKRREIIDEAREEAKKILDGSNAVIERTIHDIRRAQAEREHTLEARKKLAEQKQRLSEELTDDHPLLEKASKRSSKKKKESVNPRNTAEKKKPLKNGDYVVLDNGGTPGTIEEIRGDEAVVIFGQLKTTVKINRLSPTIRKPQSGIKKPSLASTVSNDANRERQLKFNPEIDVRGMRVDEAVQAVTYFIDDAIQFSASRVRILHGTGTGALRQYIRNYLGSVDAVKHFADEDVRLGGAGITVVEL